MECFKLTKDYAYHQGDQDVVLASLALNDDFFLKISGPASDVIPLLEQEVSYEEISTYLLKKHSTLSPQIIENNLPKMLKYLADCEIIVKSKRTKSAKNTAKGPSKRASTRI